MYIHNFIHSIYSSPVKFHFPDLFPRKDVLVEVELQLFVDYVDTQLLK